MELHLRPRLFNSGFTVDLLDIVIQPFGLELEGGTDLMLGRPYPNKNYLVACRKKGRKAIDGIRLNVRGTVESFDYAVRWLVEDTVVTHHVRCSLLDRDFKAATESVVLWRPFDTWSSRIPENFGTNAAIYVEPVMQLRDKTGRRPRTTDILDEETGWIIERHQSFAMPTVEPERLLNNPCGLRVPPPEDAYEVIVPQRPCRVPLGPSGGAGVRRDFGDM